jgi:hypothetical protein
VIVGTSWLTSLIRTVIPSALSAGIKQVNFSFSRFCQALPLPFFIPFFNVLLFLNEKKNKFWDSKAIFLYASTLETAERF